MEWLDLPESELFEIVRRGQLHHPTNNNFDAACWTTELGKLDNPTKRDIALSAAAIHFGHEISSLRNAIAQQLPKLGKLQGLRLLAATANQQFLTARDKLNSHLAKVKKEKSPVNLTLLNQTRFDTHQGQSFNADDLTTSLVDALPCWLHRIASEEVLAEENIISEPHNIAGLSLSTASIENGLRSIWQETLWTNARLESDGTGLVNGWSDKVFASRWFAWSLRQETLLAYEVHLETAARTLFGRNLVPQFSGLHKTATRMFWHGGQRRFRFGRPQFNGPQERAYVMERDMLQRIYTGLFLDEPLPKAKQLCCRQLLMAWWALSDMGRLIAADLMPPWFETDDEVGRFSILLERETLLLLLETCLEITRERANEIIDFFTCDLSDTRQLFAKGVWATPLLPVIGKSCLHLILAPLLVGSPVRRVEAWLERGGIADHKGLKSRGTPFEDHVRITLSEALASNSTLTNTNVLSTGLKRVADGEEIDFIARIGNIILLGEVKCLIAPTEPIDKKNLLETLNGATEQAARKKTWLENNINEIAAKLAINDKKTISTLKVQPVVILNHGFGLGLSRYNVPVVDLHYLRLILASSSYQGDTRYEKDVGMLSVPKLLYRDQTQFETQIADLLENPPPLEPFLNAIGWRRERFPTSFGKEFYLDLPTLQHAPVDLAAMRRLETAASASKIKGTYY